MSTSVRLGNISGYIVRHQGIVKIPQSDGSLRIFPPRLVASVVVELEDGSHRYVPVFTRRFSMDEEYDREEERVALHDALAAKMPMGMPCRLTEDEDKRSAKNRTKVELVTETPR